jgi:response regulator RpfG family c-di-GMP phosphodiesterase
MVGQKRELKNVKVLPFKTKRELVSFMKTVVAPELGVKCNFCHNLTDYSSDEKDHKKVARKMMAMVNTANQTMNELNFHLFTFKSPVEAIEFIQNHSVDIVVTDYVMPQINGLELLDTIMSFDPNLYTILVTAEREEALMSVALEKGATDFLTKPIKPYELRPKIKNLLRLRNAKRLVKIREKEMILRLSKTAEYKDTDTGRHIERVGMYSELLAKSYGLNRSQSEVIMLAAPLHDVGKISVPDHILRKSAKLDPDEWKIMQQHTIIGYKIFEDTEISLLKCAGLIALYHHEKWNGQGYPVGLTGDDIPLEARIVAIADVFDALTMKRPYKEPWPLEKAFDLIKKEQGKHFDPELVDIFLKNEDKIRKICLNFQDDEKK